MKKILQIISAQPGWRAVFDDTDDSPPKGKEKVVYDDIVCWALVEDDHGGEVVGMTEQGGYIDLASEFKNLIGYVAPGMNYPRYTDPLSELRTKRKQSESPAP